MKKFRWLVISAFAVTIFCGTAFAEATDANLDNQIQASQQAIDSGLAKLDLETLRPEVYDAVMEAAPYAYLNLESLNTARNAVSEEKVIESRNVIINSQSWVRDGGWSAIYHKSTGELTVLPEFHDLFPIDWNPPIVNDSVTENFEAAFEDESVQADFGKTSISPYVIYNRYVEHTYKNVDLKYPSSTSNTPAFGSWTTRDFQGLESLHALECVGLSSSKTWNAGHSKGFVSEGSATDLAYDDEYWMMFEGETTYRFRASSYDGPATVDIDLYQYYEYNI